MTATELLTKKLKAKNYSVTKPRLITFDVLSSSKQPLTMQDLIRRTNSQVDRASVYRAIDMFEEVGITQRIYSGWKYKIELSDDFLDHHHHFTCLNCGDVITVNNPEIEDIINGLAADKDFTISSHQLEIQGYCAKCV